MKHLNFILYLILALFSIDYSISQPIYFNNRYNLCQNYEEDAWSNSSDILELNDGYVIVGATVDTESFWMRRIPIMVIDKYGNIIEYKNYGNETVDFYKGWPGSFRKSISSEEYFLAGSLNYWNPSNYDVGLLVKFSASFDTLWTREYNLNDDSNPDTSILFNQMDICFNSDLIFAGSMNGSHLLLLRTDSSGNTLWYKLFHFGSYTLCTGYSVIQTSDSGFALGGFMYTIGQPETGNPIIIKTDSLGNQQWVKFLGGPNLDDAAILALSDDGKIIMGSTYGDYMQGDDPVSRINIAKLDNSGNIIWDKKYGISKKYNHLLNIRTLHNGGIIATGTCPADFPHYSGWILKVDKNGDSIWYREYNYLTGPESRNYLYNVIETSDNELIACGDVIPKIPDTGRRDAWVIKLDSIGCDSVGCDTTVGVKENGGMEAKGRGELEIWPNPARDWISLTLPDIVSSGNIELGIYNIFGQEIMKSSVALQNRVVSLNISTLSSGFYLAVCKDPKSKVFKGKFVVGK